MSKGQPPSAPASRRSWHKRPGCTTAKCNPHTCSGRSSRWRSIHSCARGPLGLQRGVPQRAWRRPAAAPERDKAARHPESAPWQKLSCSGRCGRDVLSLRCLTLTQRSPMRNHSQPASPAFCAAARAHGRKLVLRGQRCFAVRREEAFRIKDDYHKFRSSVAQCMLLFSALLAIALWRAGHTVSRSDEAHRPFIAHSFSPIIMVTVQVSHALSVGLVSLRAIESARPAMVSGPSIQG